MTRRSMPNLAIILLVTRHNPSCHTHALEPGGGEDAEGVLHDAEALLHQYMLCCTNTCTQVAGCMLNLCYTNLSKFASATAISLTGIPPSGCYRMERFGLAAHYWRVAPLTT
jgi:hypothetical protein